jgi:hypothetical protein
MVTIYRSTTGLHPIQTEPRSLTTDTDTRHTIQHTIRHTIQHSLKPQPETKDAAEIRMFSQQAQAQTQTLTRTVAKLVLTAQGSQSVRWRVVTDLLQLKYAALKCSCDLCVQIILFVCNVLIGLID